MDGMSPIDWSYSPSYASGFNERNVLGLETVFAILTILCLGHLGIFDFKSPFIYDVANCDI